VKRGEYPFSFLNITIPFDQLDVNVHPMKIEVKFIDEWRVYHVVKSAVSNSISSILSTIPSLQHNQQFHGFNKNFESNQNQESINFIFSESKTDNDFQRAKDYINRFQFDSKQSSVYEGSTLWQVHNKYIISQINSGLVIIDQHVAHERVLYEEALNAFDNTPLSAQTLLFSEELEFSPDEFTVLLEILIFSNKEKFQEAQ
jgi:DNA mismatch repair protein MutL